MVQRLASAPFSATGNDAAPNLAERCTKPLVWVSLAGTLVVATWGAAYTFPLLRIIVPAATVAAWLLARSKPVVAVQALLAAFYLVPAAFMLSVVFVPAGCWVVWMAPLAAAMLASTPASRWTMPDLLKVPLACWAMVVALTWPIVLVREADFVLARIHPNSAWWATTVAAATMLGILWMDALFAGVPAERGDDRAYVARVVVPIAAGWALSSFLAIYQLFGDINFLNRGLWGYMQRARGTFADANPFGVLSAIWGPLMFALAIERWRGWRRYLGAAALPLSWLAVWASGSRSSLPITALALAFIVGHYLRPGKSRRGVRAAAVAAALVVTVAAGAIASRGSGVESPLKRMAASFGPRLSLEWLAETAARLEARDGYGTIASFVIRQFPLVGTGVGTFHDLVPMYARMLFHGPLQPDNAQNWFRHQLVEFGLLGSLGWIAWVGVLLWALAFGRTASRALTAGVLRGVLVGFGLISLVGMPGQDVTVVITFWVMAFWYLLLLDSKTTTTLARRIPAAAWVVVWAIALGHAAATAYVARGGMRPPIRIAAADLDYSYGFYAPEPGGTARWAAKQAVETVPVPPNRRRMEITVWVNHLDVASSPVDARVWVDRQLVVDTRLSSIEPVTRTVEIAGARPRAVVETWVSRTLNPRDFGVPDDRQLGLLVDWKFLDSPPPDTVP